MNGQSCAKCRYYLPVAKRRIMPVQYDGRCRRSPPVIVGPTLTDASQAPVNGSDWCGEYAPAHSETIDESAALICRLYLMGDKSAAYGAIDKIQELRQEEGSS